MRQILCCSSLLAASLSLAVHAQAPLPSAANNYRQESLVIERSDTTMRMHADGTGERIVHAVVRIQSQGAAQQFGVLSFGYASAFETPHIALVRVHKADGTVVDTPATDAIDMAAAVTREAPLYSDLKEKQLPVRSLSPGDTLEYEVDTTIDKTQAPGQFWGTAHFTAPGTIIVLAETLTLEVPKEKYVQVWSPNHKPEITEDAHTRTYHWNVPQLAAAPKAAPGEDSTKVQPPKDIDEDEDGRKLPSVAWTTFHTWAEAGNWYRELAIERAQPNDALRARATEITKDAKTPEEQVRAIYDFVSTRTRYVGIDFGVGRYQPHAAEEVLVNQYGDCKDKDTLLEALLRAKGFSTAPALIGVGLAPVLEVPSPGVFNHVITTVNLPAGQIWLDSTPGAAPYRYLLALIRDEKALVVPAEGPSTLQSTPAAAPYAFEERFEAEGDLDAEGKFTAKMTASYHDDSEYMVRAIARNLAPADWDKASQYLSSNSGFGGATSNTRFKNVEDSTAPIVITYDYSRHPYGDWDNLRIVPATPFMAFPELESDSHEPSADIEFGAPRTMVAISRIRLPEGFRTDLPDPVHVKTDFVTFDKTYRFDGHEIVVERTIVILKKKLPKEDWKRYQSFTKEIHLDNEPWIPLIRTGKATVASTPRLVTREKDAKQPDNPISLPQNDASKRGAEGSAGATAKELMQQFKTEMQARDFQSARATLDKVKAVNPEERMLWSGYGALAELQGNMNDAKTDFHKEIALYPDEDGPIYALANAESRNGEASEAQSTLQNYLDRHPGDLRIASYLVSLQVAAQNYSAALKTLQAVADQNPDNRYVRLQIAETLLHLKRNDEAAAAAKSVLDGTDDVNLLNGAGYLLAEAGLDLPYAESVSRQSIEKLEAKSATISAAEANSRAFGEANLLVASWDTLGWILYREGNADEGRSLIAAAWRAGLDAEVGDHLGQIDEALQKKGQACADYRLAEAALKKSDKPEVSRHIRESIARLEAAGIKPQAKYGAEDLQKLRTYKVQRPEGASGWGAFRLEITAQGVIESQQMSGEHQIAGIARILNQMKFPELIPPNSKAHLLRSAVVSCSQNSICEVVLVPEGGLQTEQQ
jgi:transglutaminase-like putative cysteine protease/Flp pilus assembly protein TadD